MVTDVARLHDLTPAQRRVVEALLEGQRRLVAKWVGHVCSVCGDTPLAVPPDLSLTEAARRARLLRSIHLTRMSIASIRARASERTPG